MVIGNLNWIVGYIWGIADDVLRDLYVRGTAGSGNPHVIQAHAA
jgi:hypothetical protein